jgi:circadian clock protein KaiC
MAKHANERTIRRIPTGIPGLDRVLAGGLFETGVCIVQGPPGAGKTILANQICFHQAEQKRRAMYFTLLTESHERMLGFIQGMSFFKPAAIPDGVSYVSAFRVLESDGLMGVARNIRDAIAARRPTFLVVDGLAVVEELAKSDTALKKFIHELQTISAMFHTAILLLTNVGERKRLEALHTMVDGIIELSAPIIRLKPQRTLEVGKLRGAGQVRGTHTLVIDDDGVRVLPRVESILPSDDHGERRSNDQQRRTTGIAGLDQMLHGGLPVGSNTMLMGPSGIGKTMMGLHFLEAGLSNGEKGLYLTFYERREELRMKAERLGLKGIRAGLDNGNLSFLWQSSVEANVDRIGDTLLRTFEKHRPTRVLIDGLHGFQVTADPPERIQDFFAALADHITGHGACLFYTVETREILGGEAICPPFSNASRMTHNILLMRFTELAGELHRVLSIVKMRDSDFDPSIRELVIADHGIEIGDQITTADMLLKGHASRTGAREPGAKG